MLFTFLIRTVACLVILSLGLGLFLYGLRSLIFCLMTLSFGDPTLTEIIELPFALAVAIVGAALIGLVGYAVWWMI